MQERYLGDSHDFLKYKLLRSLRDDLELRIGVNWYLTRPEDLGESGNNDGEKRHHLEGGEWEKWDSKLLERIRPFKEPTERRLDLVRNSGVLPDDTLYFEDIVPVKRKERCSWHQSARATLACAGLVFLDPDNGFEVKSMRKRPKYSLFQEAVDFLLMGKIVVGIQFARQCDPIKWGFTQREQLHVIAGNQDMLPIVRGRVSPNILFLTLAPPQQVERVRKVLCDFADRSPRVVRGNQRAEIIKGS